jgi:hypothetical protein
MLSVSVDPVRMHDSGWRAGGHTGCHDLATETTRWVGNETRPLESTAVEVVAHGRDEQFIAAAGVIRELVDEHGEAADAYVKLRVRPGITAADTICCASFGEHAQGGRAPSWRPGCEPEREFAATQGNVNFAVSDDPQHGVTAGGGGLLDGSPARQGRARD